MGKSLELVGTNNEVSGKSDYLISFITTVDIPDYGMDNYMAVYLPQGFEVYSDSKLVVTPYSDNLGSQDIELNIDI